MTIAGEFAGVLLPGFAGDWILRLKGKFKGMKGSTKKGNISQLYAIAIEHNPN